MGGAGAECQKFPSKISCLTVPEFFVGQTFRVSLVSGLEKFLCFRGLSHNCLSKFFVSQCREILYGNPSVMCVRKFLVAKKFMDKKGGVSTFSVGNFSVTVPKNFIGEPFTASLIPGIKKFYA